MVASLGSIYQWSVSLLAPQNLPETYQRIVHEVCKLTGAEYGSIFLLNEGKLVRTYTTVPLKYQIVPEKNDLIFKSIQAQRPVAITLSQARGMNHFGDRRPFPLAAIPLTFNQTTTGVILLKSSKTLRFSKQKLEILKLFSAIASLKIRNVELYYDAKIALESRNAFVSMASHELRTPLTSIKGYTELMGHSLATGRVPNVEWITSLKYETQQLARLVEELLEIKRMKDGAIGYRITSCSAQTIIDRAIKDVAEVYPEHTFNYSHTGDAALIYGNEEKLTQVISSILHNAAKFSSPNTEVTIKVDCGDQSCQIMIQDRGVGMTTDEVKQAFGEFYKGKVRTTDGMGLGLYLCRQIINEHQGNISIDSQKDQGTKVMLTLPLHQANHSSPRPL